ncbi:MAG: ABC transporter ATP-binding protein, partial [Flavobacterium sp.]|nr:ABC transporter ATP-binding protein [Flavobacterium sp.]
DRYFMDKMVDHLFVFEGQGAIKDIIGNYTEFRKQTAVDYKKEKAAEKDPTPVKEVKVTQLSNTSTQEKRKLSFKEKSEFDQLEKDLEALETAKEAQTAVLSDGSATNDQIMEAGNKLAEIVAAIDSKTERWLELAEFV